MGQETLPRHFTFAILALLLSMVPGCKLQDEFTPTGPTGADAVAGDGTLNTSSSSEGANISAPIISDPLSGSVVSSTQPSLTVLNAATGGGEATYLFQVAADSGFSTIEAQSGLVQEGGNGETSWNVETPLAEGRHFWRVRARAGTVDGPFSSTADFRVGDGATTGEPPPDDPPPAPTPAGTVISDPLSGGSIGDVFGGRFSSRGWTVTGPGNFIRYEVPPMSEGWVEFETIGLRPTNPAHNQFMLFGMWDPSAGDYRANPFRVHLQKLHPNPHNPPYLRLRWIANGEQHDDGNLFNDWNPRRTYTWRIEWGPAGTANQARVLLDGQVMIVTNYNRTYRPNVHFIELGIGERGESIEGVTYSNFRVGN